MGAYIQILVFVILGIVLLWFGYNLFFGRTSPLYSSFSFWKKKEEDNENEKGKPGDPQVCPVCSKKLVKGELVKTIAYPSDPAKIGRLMYIRGCTNCLRNDFIRRCPICGIDLELEDYLVARIFHRRDEKDHVHVLGCNQCRNAANPDK